MTVKAPLSSPVIAPLQGRFDPLRMHIGVNTGPALLGATKIEGRAGTRWTYTASGMTTNIAARLAALAEGGEIVLSEENVRPSGRRRRARGHGAARAQGVERAVRVFRLR